MLEKPEQFKTGKEIGPTGAESGDERIQELSKRRNFLAEEIKGLLEEGGLLIAKNSDDEATFSRLSEINRREAEIVEEQGDLEKEIAKLFRKPV